MTIKQKILRMIERLDDNVDYDRVIYHLEVMRAVDVGLEQAARGEGIEHEEFMKQLEKEWQNEESSGRPKRKRTSKESEPSSPAARPKRRKPTRAG